jgi:hypothetical protein
MVSTSRADTVLRPGDQVLTDQGGQSSNGSPADVFTQAPEGGTAGVLVLPGF